MIVPYKQSLDSAFPPRPKSPAYGPSSSLHHRLRCNCTGVLHVVHLMLKQSGIGNLGDATCSHNLARTKVFYAVATAIYGYLLWRSDARLVVDWKPSSTVGNCLKYPRWQSATRSSCLISQVRLCQRKCLSSSRYTCRSCQKRHNPFVAFTAFTQ